MEIDIKRAYSNGRAVSKTTLIRLHNSKLNVYTADYTLKPEYEYLAITTLEIYKYRGKEDCVLVKDQHGHYHLIKFDEGDNFCANEHPYLKYNFHAYKKYIDEFKRFEDVIVAFNNEKCDLGVFTGFDDFKFKDIDIKFEFVKAYRLGAIYLLELSELLNAKIEEYKPHFDKYEQLLKNITEAKETLLQLPQIL